MTILDLLKLDTWLATDYVWLEWDNGENQWVVYTDRNTGLQQRVIETPDEAEAVAAFVRAAGIDAAPKE
jgi:hypothetical protein